MPLYDTYDEHDTSEDNGTTLWHAIARQVNGNPDSWEHIRDAVLEFIIHVRCNPTHPYHNDYLRHEASFSSRRRGKDITEYISRPDFCADRNLLIVTAEALQVHLRVYIPGDETGTSDLQLKYTCGLETLRPCAILRKTCQVEKRSFFSAVLPDQSGAELQEYLLSTKQPRLCIFGLAHCHGPDGEDIFTYFNENRLGSTSHDLMADTPLSQVHLHTLTVNDPREIAAALELFHQALEFAPNQKLFTRLTTTGNTGFVRRHCGADNEFIYVPVDKVRGKTDQEIEKLLRAGEIEHVVSTFTIGISDMFFINFNIYEMLINANKFTIPGLEELFRGTVFNSEIIKIWFNYQNDIKVFENTIANMYQGTPREPFIYRHYSERGNPAAGIQVQPRFHFRSEHLQGERPSDLEFPSTPIDQQHCDFHEPELNDLGMSCPCSLGNIDLNAFIAFLCRQHGLDVKKLGWQNPRMRFNFMKLLKCMLKHDRRYRILKWMKERADPAPSNGLRSKLDFYQSLGQAGMEKDNDAMAYVIGDVLSLIIIFEQLLGSDDKAYVAGLLYSYFNPDDGASSVAPRLAQAVSRRTSLEDLPLFDDMPRTFSSEDFDPALFHHSFRDPTQLWKTDSLSFSEHELRIRVTREMLGNPEIKRISPHAVYECPTAPSIAVSQVQQDMALQLLTDPTRHMLPSCCAEEYPSKYPGPICRAGTSRLEALADFILSRYEASDETGVPMPWLHMTLGKKLEDLLAARAKPSLASTLPTHLIQQAHKMINSSNLRDSYPERVYEAKVRTRNMIMAELEINKQLGEPTLFDSSDVFDPEGREYRARLNTTANWNKIVMQPLPPTNRFGGWQSQSMLVLEQLHIIMSDATISRSRRPSNRQLGGAVQARATPFQIAPPTYNHQSYGQFGASPIPRGLPAASRPQAMAFPPSRSTFTPSVPTAPRAINPQFSGGIQPRAQTFHAGTPIHHHQNSQQLGVPQIHIALPSAYRPQAPTCSPPILGPARQVPTAPKAMRGHQMRGSVNMERRDSQQDDTANHFSVQYRYR